HKEMLIPKIVSRVEPSTRCSRRCTRVSVTDDGVSPRTHENVRVLYRDDDCMVVDKPAGMIVHRGQANDTVDLLRVVRNLASRHVYPAHRLDRGASGCVAFALHPEAASVLGRAFSEGFIRKH